jgi:hypothetical protein
LAVCSQLQLGLAHRTVWWRTGQCPVPQAGRRQPITLGNRWRCMTINHRTVWWCTRLSSESSAMNSSVSGIEEGDVAKIHRTVRWCIGLSGEPTTLVANGRLRNLRVTCVSLRRSFGHTEHCPVRQRVRRSNDRLRPIWKEIEHQT